MKTLRLNAGDLVPGPGGFDTVSGPSRIIQDLRVALAEPLGVDRFHPGWGSRVDDFIGLPLNGMTAFDLEQEINRVVGNYMMVHAEKARVDAQRGTGKYTRSDLLSHVSDIKVTHRLSSASVMITIATMSGDEFMTTIEVESTNG